MALIYFCALMVGVIVIVNHDAAEVQAKTVNKDITIGKGKSYAIEQDINVSRKATYKTSNKKVATAKKGKITGKSIGTAKITIKDKGNTYIYKVTVSKVYLSAQKVTLNVKKSATIRVKGTKSRATWKSSNKKVATVKNGKITAKKKGKAVVTAKIKGTVLKCDVVVKNPQDGAGDVKNDIIYVSASADSDRENGTKEYPFQTIQEAVYHAGGGSEIIIDEGIYEPFTVPETISGTKKDITIIRAADGARPMIQVPKKSASENSIGIYMENVSYICLAGLEVSGGTHGILYESNRDAKSTTLSGITIRNCLVHDVDGVHGIAVYATNDRIPVTGLVIKECEVYDCWCGDSETVVVNGNIDGFKICKNTVHDNNNIGIDMIGFEGTALHEASYDGNRYDVDFVRNGQCYGNRVYNISAEGNTAYLEDGEYSLCAAGIYVDGGQNIRIYDNEISNCDIGIEVATEHNPKENPLFQVAGIEVYDNEITGCSGFAGLAFGGYDSKRGFTVDCHFYRNTLTDNPVQIVVQRSRNNEIDHNTIIGGKTYIEYNDKLPKEEMKNNFHDNVRKKSK